MPEALISSTTSPGPGVGSGNSMKSILRSPANTTARIASSHLLHRPSDHVSARRESPRPAGHVKKLSLLHRTSGGPDAPYWGALDADGLVTGGIGSPRHNEGSTPMHKIRSTLSALLLAGALAGCAHPQSAASAKPPLYDRLGGQPAIVAVVDDFVANVAADQRINHFFAHTEPVRFKKLLVEQICAGTGGPCTYTGRSMQEAHHNMGV